MREGTFFAGFHIARWSRLVALSLQDARNLGHFQGFRTGPVSPLDIDEMVAELVAAEYIVIAFRAIQQKQRSRKD